MVDGKTDLSSKASAFTKAARAGYAVALLATVVLGLTAVVSASGIEFTSSNLLPALSLLSCLLFALIAAFGFTMYKIGSAHALQFLKVASMLIIVVSLTLLVVISLMTVIFGLYFPWPSWFVGLFVFTILSAIVLFPLPSLLFWRGIKDLKTKLYLRGLKVFRRAESVFTLIIAFSVIGIILDWLVFSSSPSMTGSGLQLWRTAEIAVFGIGGIVLLTLFAKTLGKLGHPEILARAVDAAARAPPEPRLFGIPAKRSEWHELPASLRDTFKQIESDAKFEYSMWGVKHLVSRKGNIFVLIPEMLGGPYMAYFIKLFSQIPSTKKKFRAPMLRPRTVLPRMKDFSQNIGGFQVAELRGDFTLPVDVISKTKGNGVKYASGPGIIYAVCKRDISRGLYRSLVKPSPEDLSEKFDKTAILKIIDKLSKEKAN